MSEISLGTVVITGASSGIGAVYAHRLAQRGYNLILIARNKDRLVAQAKILSEETGRSIRAVAADLTRNEDAYEIERLLRSDSDIAMLINNAGVGATSPLLQSDIDKMDDMIALNISALTRLTYAVVPGFVERNRGVIVNIASVVAIAPEILNGVYGASKAYVLAFSQSLQHELDHKGIRIQAVLPGITATDFWNVAGTPVGNFPKEIVMSAEDLVDAALAGLDRGEFVTIPSLEDDTKWAAFEASRQELRPHLSRVKPATRYSHTGD